MLVDIIAGVFIFLLIGWPMLTYAADAVRYVWWKLTGAGR